MPRPKEQKRLCDATVSENVSVPEEDASTSASNGIPEVAASGTQSSHATSDEVEELSSDEETEDENCPQYSSTSEDSSDEDDSASNFKWLKRDNAPSRFPFSVKPDVCSGLDRDSTPAKIFYSFVTKELIDTLCKETNRYGSVHEPEWSPTSVDELYTYFALRILSGLNGSQNVFDAWDEGSLLSRPIFPETMPLDRFEELTANLHFVDNSVTRPTGDRLWKLRPALDSFQIQFASVCVPPERLAVDKHRWTEEAKVYRLRVCEGVCAGYTCAFRIVVGSHRKDFPTASKVVKDLMTSAGLYDKGYALYTGIDFTSPRLFHFLQTRGTNAVGEINLQSHFVPQDLHVFNSGEVDYRSTRGGLLALQWMGKDPLTLLSNAHTAEQDDGSSRSSRKKPKVVVDYLRAMKGLPPYFYRAQREYVKWYTRILFRLVDMSINNSYAVYRMLGGKDVELQFRYDLVGELLDCHAKKLPLTVQSGKV